MKHPETAALARAAYDASGEKSVAAFVKLFRGAIGLRTFWGWMRGEQPASPIAQLLLRDLVEGRWSPRRDDA